MQINEQTFRRKDVLLTLGMVLPPVILLTQLELKYMLVHRACMHDTKLFLLAIDVLAIAACLASGLMSRSQTPERERDRFQWLVGQGAAALFTIVAIAMTIPDVVLKACD